jgi:hypothetical protein
LNEFCLNFLQTFQPLAMSDLGLSSVLEAKLFIQVFNIRNL